MAVQALLALGEWVNLLTLIYYVPPDTPIRCSVLVPCGVAINTLVDLNKLAGETPSFFYPPGCTSAYSCSTAWLGTDPCPPRPTIADLRDWEFTCSALFVAYAGHRRGAAGIKPFSPQTARCLLQYYGSLLASSETKSLRQPLPEITMNALFSPGSTWPP